MHNYAHTLSLQITNSVSLNLLLQCQGVTGFHMCCICSRPKSLRLPAGESPRPALREAHVPQVRHRGASAPSATSVAQTPAVTCRASQLHSLGFLYIWAITGVFAWHTTAASAAHRPRGELQTNQRFGHVARASNRGTQRVPHANCVILGPEATA